MATSGFDRYLPEYVLRFLCDSVSWTSRSTQLIERDSLSRYAKNLKPLEDEERLSKNGSLTTLLISSVNIFPFPLNERWCGTQWFAQILSPLIDYSGYELTKIQFNYREMWKQTGINLLLGSRVGHQLIPPLHPSQIQDLIVFDQFAAFQMISHGMPSGREIGSFSIWATLVTGFSVDCVFLALAAILVPVFWMTFFTRAGRTLLAYVTRVAHHAFNGLTIFVYPNQSDYYTEFIERHMRRSRFKLTRLSLAYLAMVTCIMSILYAELFGGDIFSDLILEPLEYVNDVTDFLRMRSQWNLTFHSTALNVQRLKSLAIDMTESDPALSELIELGLDNSVVWKWDDILGAVKDRFAVLVTGPENGCQLLIYLADTNWRSGNYHCSASFARSVTPTFYILRSRLNDLGREQKIRLRRLCRATTESYLLRRLDKKHQWMYQHGTMNDDKFVPQGSRIAQVLLDSISIFIFNYATLLSGVGFIQLILIVCHHF